MQFTTVFQDEQIVYTLRIQLSWTHGRTIIYMEVPLKKPFYIEMYKLENLLLAIKIADRSFLFDNSNEMELIAETLNGEIILHKDAEFLPNWFIQYVINKIV